MGIVAVALLALAGCSHGKDIAEGLPTTTAWNGEGTMLNADYMCRTYVPGPIVDAITTTVQAFRDLRIRPGVQYPNAFPKFSSYTAAAWCWTGHKGAYNVYEVAPDGSKVKIASNMNIARYDDKGAPVIP